MTPRFGEASPSPVGGCAGTRRRRIAGTGALAAWVLAAHAAALAQSWSVTEFQYQGGRALRPHAVSPDGFQHIQTLQHASGWKYGENFFFVDMICCSGSQADREVYLEWYPYLSLGAITGRKLSWGPIRDAGPLFALNWGAQAKFLALGPAARIQLDLPGFAFANLDYMYLLDRTKGLEAGGAPKEGPSHVVDFNWGLPFKVGKASFSFEGHGEWKSPRDTEFGVRAPYWILLQPQFRVDLGKALAGLEGRWFAGIEFHVWINKFGFKDAREILPQLLMVYRF